MAIEIPGMASAIQTAFAIPKATPAEFSLAVATAMVTYLKANAEVDPAGTLLAPAGGGPCTGKGKIK